MRYPKDVEIWEHAPGRKLVEVVIQVKNTMEAMAECSRAVSEMGVNMLTGFQTAPGTSPVARWSFFADITDSKVGLSEFGDSLRRLDSIKSVDVVASDGGLMVDRQHFPVQWAGRRALILRAEAMNEMLYRLWSVFGSGAGTIIDQMAEAMGRHSAKEVVEDFGPEFAIGHVDELLGSYTALGYGEASIERNKSSQFPVVVHTRALFECEANAKRKLHQRSVFFKAHLRGFISGIFERPFEVKEVQCLTQGDEVCSFQIAMMEAPVPGLPARASTKNSKAFPKSSF